MIPPLPPEMQSDVDALAAALYRGDRNDLAFARLTSWLGKHASDAIFGHAEQGIVALSPRTLRDAFAGLDDDEISEARGLAGRTISLEDRVACFEEHVVPRLFENADISSGFSPMSLRAGNGDTIILVNDVRGYSFSGITIEWRGPYRTFDEFRKQLADEGWLLDGETFSELPTVAKLTRLNEADES